MVRAEGLDYLVVEEYSDSFEQTNLSSGQLQTGKPFFKQKLY